MGVRGRVIIETEERLKWPISRTASFATKSSPTMAQPARHADAAIVT